MKTTINVGKGIPLHNNYALQLHYENVLKRMVIAMRKETEFEISTLFRQNKSVLTQDSAKNKSISTKTKLLIAALLLKFRLMFKGSARPIAKSMVSSMERYSASAVRSSLNSLTGKNFDTNPISKLGAIRSQALVDENISLIKSLPEQYFTQITSIVMQAISSGLGTQLESSLMKQGNIVEKRAVTIALDQTRKAMQAISMQKMLDQGIKRFQWIYTFRSKEPRPSHVKMDKNIYRFDDPPVVNADKSKEAPRHGFPGTEINCKCIMRPVAEWEK